LSVDLHSGAVVFIDFIDLVGDVEGRVLCSSWSEYLERVAGALESPNWEGSKKLESFGFEGTNELFAAVFPNSRVLKIEEGAGICTVAKVRTAVAKAIN
jgi:hypothetical protein